MMLHLETAKRGQRGTLLRQMSEEKAERRSGGEITDTHEQREARFQQDRAVVTS